MTHTPLGKKNPAPRAIESVDQDVAIAEIRLTWQRRLLLSPSLGLTIVIIGFVLYGMTQSDQFINGLTWVNILRDAVFTSIVASFGTLVFITGGLDLSVGSVLAAGSMVSAHFADGGMPWPLAFLVGMLVGAAIGALNGAIINYFLISPIIVTLGSLFSVQAVVTALSHGNPIGPVPAGFQSVGQGSWLGLPYLVYYAIGFALLAHLLLSVTNFGWALRSTGGNITAARSAGIPVRRLSITVYVFSGAAAALAGALQAAQLGSASPDLGSGFELQVIAAVIIGGTSIAGAIGSVTGSLLGALLLSVLGTGLILLHVDPNWQDFVTGIVLVVAAGIDQLRRRQMFRASAKRARGATRTG